MTKINSIKLHCPQIEDNTLNRDYLIDILNNSIQRKLSLISAPAGYGKTTLLCQWLMNNPSPVVWFSLDRYDCDLRVFLSYLIRGFQAAFDSSFRNTEQVLNAPKLPSISELRSILIQDIIQLPKFCILVLEDYHLISQSKSHELIASLFRYLPSTIHLVISSRIDPAFPIARLRLQQEIKEIRTVDLKFDSEQIKLYWQQNTGQQLSDSTKLVLEKQTEGWIAGIKLAAISLASNKLNRDEKHIGESLFNIKKSEIFDYLLEEVLNQQKLSVQEFLLKTSILNFFSSSLCNTILESAESQDIIEQLKKNNLFLVSLDNHQRWYRYHHLFQNLLRLKLRSRFSQEHIAFLHYKAGIWLAENGFVELGIIYLLKSGDEVSAAKIVEKYRYQILNEDTGIILEKWLKFLPNRVIEQRPSLLLTKAWALYFYLNLSGMPSVLKMAEELLNQENLDLTEDEIKILRGEINLFWSKLLYFQGEGERAFIHAQKALELIPITYEFARGYSFIFLSYSAQMMGQSELKVRQYFEQGIQEAQVYNSSVKPKLLWGLAFYYSIAGNLNKLEEIAQSLIPPIIEKQKIQTLGLTYFLMGMVYYEWNRLDEAAYYFSSAVDLRYSISSKIFYECLTGLILTYQVQGYKEKKEEKLKLLLKIISEDSYDIYRHLCNYFQIWLCLQQNDIQGAIELQQKFDKIELETSIYFRNISEYKTSFDLVNYSQKIESDSEISAHSFLFLNVPFLTQARADIARNTKTSLQSAITLLNKCLQLTQKWHNSRKQIEVLALLALAYDAQKQTKVALENLEKAILLGFRGRFIRTFVDCGSNIVPLLSQLAEQKVAQDYIRQILAAFPPKEESNKVFVEPLTPRELEVIKLLQQRLTNQEIADKLFISPRTVKKHTLNIYEKLRVHNRRKAVTVAQTLGII